MNSFTGEHKTPGSCFVYLMNSITSMKGKDKKVKIKVIIFNKIYSWFLTAKSQFSNICKVRKVTTEPLSSKIKWVYSIS